VKILNCNLACQYFFYVAPPFITHHATAPSLRTVVGCNLFFEQKKKWLKLVIRLANMMVKSLNLAGFYVSKKNLLDY
jgi:hypothetical protein